MSAATRHCRESYLGSHATESGSSANGLRVSRIRERAADR